MSFGLFSFAKLPRSRTWFFSKMEAHSFSAFKLCTLCGMVNDSKSRLCINYHYSPCSCFPPISLGVDFALKFGWIFEEKNSKRPFGGVFPNTTAIPGLCEVHLLLLLVFWFAIWLKQTPVSTSGDPVTPFCASTSGVTMCVTLTPSHCAI